MGSTTDDEPTNGAMRRHTGPQPAVEDEPVRSDRRSKSWRDEFDIKTIALILTVMGTGNFERIGKMLDRMAGSETAVVEAKAAAGPDAETLRRVGVLEKGHALMSRRLEWLVINTYVSMKTKKIPITGELPQEPPQ